MCSSLASKRPFSLASQAVSPKLPYQEADISHKLGMTKATNAANYIFWLEQLQPSIRETDENREIGPGKLQSLELENLQFCYPMRPNARVLRGIDLHVRHSAVSHLSPNR